LRIEDFTRQVAQFAQHAREALAYATSRIPVPQIVIAMGHVWVLGYGAHLVGEGKINIGELVASVLLANSLILRVEGIGRVMQIFADARSSAARIWELLDAKPRLQEGTRTLPQDALGIRLINASVNPQHHEKPVLNHCNFQINPGEIVALVGTTGSGKSTLMGLLPRLIDVDSGKVEIGSDTAGWHNIRDFNSEELRKRVHVVPQESFLFSDSLATNLRLGKPDASEAELREALRIANASDVVERMENGLETRIGDRGITLSGGQRQRICLARALLGEASIIGLDDATSALDAATERTILDNIRNFRLSHNRTVTLAIVSSKLSTVLLADRVLVLAHGEIVAEGTHEQLVRDNRAYRELMGI